MKENLNLTSPFVSLAVLPSALLPAPHTHLSSVFYHRLLSVAHGHVLIITWKLLIQSGDKRLQSDREIFKGWCIFGQLEICP